MYRLVCGHCLAEIEIASMFEARLLFGRHMRTVHREFLGPPEPPANPLQFVNDKGDGITFVNKTGQPLTFDQKDNPDPA